MRSPPRILHLIDALDGYGPTRQLELLVAEQLANGYEVRVWALCARRESIAMLNQLGVDCRILHRRWDRDPLTAIRLARALRSQPQEILHLWGQTSLDYFRSIQRILPSLRTITSLPDRTLLMGEPGDFVPPGVALPSQPRDLRRSFFAEQCLPDDAVLIALAGPLTRDQCVDAAIWNFELVHILDERARLIIFGDGPDRSRVERFARKASTSHAVRFLGYRSDYRELLGLADLFWHTAAPSTALPLSAMEAIAAGVPVVANDGPGCRQLIDDNRTGYLVSNNDRALFARQSRTLVEDRQLADRLRARAKEKLADAFSVGTMTQRYADLYAELLGR